MTALFLSHSSRDEESTARILEQLRAEGITGLFVDFDPADGIPAGRSWEEELYAQLRRCDAVVFLASVASVASAWCFAELVLARSLGKKIIPVRLDQAARLSLLDSLQWIDQNELLPQRLRAGLRRAGLDPNSSFAWDALRSPYPGLTPFGLEDAAVFFGREQETSRLVELFQPTLQHGPGRCIAIVGPSGSGKSSLLRAGLLPRLAAMPSRWVTLPPLRPGDEPTRNLARSLVGALTTRGLPGEVSAVEASLSAGSAGLRRLARELGARTGDGSAFVLVVVDQAEELLTRSGVREQQAFLSLLRGALGEDSPLCVVATIRSEFLSTAPDRAGLAEIIDDSLVLEPLSRSRLAEVIEGPAQRAGVEFAPGLVERVVLETEGGDALPMLAYTLSELYKGIGPDRRITAEHYENLGGVEGALRNTADRLADELRKSGRPVLPTLLTLATVDGASEPTRRRVQRDALGQDERAVVDAFVDARLLTSDGSWVEVAHEALLRRWAPLREAIEDARSWLRLRTELDRLTADWEHSDRDDSFLVRGTRLAAFDRWAVEHRAELSSAQRAFLDASRARTAVELEAARRSNRRLRLLSTALAGLLVLVLAVGVVAIRASVEAQAQTLLALSRQVEAEANRLADTQPDTAVLAGLQSMSLARDGDVKPGEGLVAGLARTTHASTTLSGHTDQVHAVAFDAGGRLVASAGADGSIRLWEAATGASVGPALVGHDGRVLAVAFSPTGGVLASGGVDGTVRIWDVATHRPRGELLRAHVGAVWSVAFDTGGESLFSAGTDRVIRAWDVGTGRLSERSFAGHQDTIYALAVSPDGRRLASASGDHTAQLWNIATGQPDGEPLSGHEDTVQGLAYSPDGRSLATASWDATVRIWDVASHQPSGAPLAGYSQPVRDVAFSPDGTLLATGDADAAVRLWSVEARRPLGPDLRGHVSEVERVRFSPDGRVIASASWDRTVRLWDVVETPSISRPLTGHEREVRDVAFSPDGRLLATASADGTVRLWNAGSTGAEPISTLANPAPVADDPAATGESPVGVTDVAFGPDSRLLVSASEDGALRFWDVPTGQSVGGLVPAHEDGVDAVDISRDGRFVAAAGAAGEVGVWDIGSRQQVVQFAGHVDAAVYGVAFSPDGTLVASAGNDGTIRLWNIATGQQDGPTLLGHTTTVWNVTFSPDGREMASASADRTVRRWDVASRQPRGEPLTGPTGEVYRVTFSPDGRRLIAASQDSSIWTWDDATGSLQGPVLAGHVGEVLAVAFSPDGSRLASASTDNTARIWEPQFAAWLSAGCALLRRNMSLVEWNQVLPGESYERTCPQLPPGPGAPPDAPAARYSSTGG